jgi:hypothetical protein
MPNPIEEALKSLNESIALLDEKKDLIGDETYLAMKNNLLSVCKNINRATKGVNDDNDDDEYYDDASDINFYGPFTLVVTHNTSFDILLDMVSTIWRNMDKSQEIECRFELESSGCREATEKSRAYNAEQARLHNIDSTNKDVLSFNYYFRQAMCYWVGVDTKWYRNGAVFNLTGIMD